jgi:predicted CoA-binding protein
MSARNSCAERARVALVRTPRQILEESTTIAVVGASRHEEKSAYSVPLQLRLHGWHVIPVNPYAEKIWGERVYARLSDIPQHVDLVNVFRPSEQAADVVRQAIAIGAGAVWLQQGIVSAEGRRLAEEAGIDYVEDHCIAVERALSRVSRRG